MASRIPVIFLGVATNDSCSRIALAFHDGHFNLDSCILSLIDGHVLTDVEVRKDDINGTCSLPDASSTVRPKQVTFILDEIQKRTTGYGCKILAAGVDSECFFKDQLCHAFWNDLDILPFMFSIRGIYRMDTYHRFFLYEGMEIEERADSASRKVVMWFGPDRIPRLSISFRNQVEIDNGCINMVRLANYEQTVCSDTWKVLLDLSNEFKSKNTRISFFNATPQGGGVALMRHALLRLLKLLDISATWHVPKPNPAVFRITKNNHNLLQGVADPGVTFTDENMATYETWVKSNCERYWVDGPFQWSDVIVLDDPQVAGYIPYIKQANPDCKIIYRSHIEIRSDLMRDETKPQHKLWNYLWGFISQADLFIAHPIEGFIPDNVPCEKVLMMPACSDPLDGLNKYLSENDCLFWIHNLNRLSFDQMGNRLHYPHRPYICQIARFDPSKGYPDVLDSYKRLREMMDDSYPLSKVPQLVLCGHGSVDDPDSSTIYKSLIETLDKPEYQFIKCDICIVRVPPEDRVLNAVVRCASITLQLSHREGFEVKVTESLHKGTPVIVYRAGGIPLQLPPNYKYIADVGDTNSVALFLLELFTNTNLYDKIKVKCKEWAHKDEFWTVWQTINWLWLAKRVLNDAQHGEKLSDRKFNLVKNEWKAFYENKMSINSTKWCDVLK